MNTVELMNAVEFLNVLKNEIKNQQQKDTRPDSITYYYLLLDVSGSMSPLMKDLVRLYEEKIKTLFDLADQHNQTIYGNLKLFDTKVYDVVGEANRKQLLECSTLIKNKGGYTSLRDALVKTMSEVLKLKLRNNDAVFIEVITDGLENASHYTPTKFHKQHSLCIETQKFSLICQVPTGTKDTFVQQFELSPDNVCEWETSVQGLTQVHGTTSLAYKSYMQSRADGQTQSQTFYKDLDLKGIENKLSSLDNCTDNFKLLKVDKEAPIKDFIEKKTKKPYIIGSTYYELTQDDNKVQPNKAIVIMDKDTKTIYGGSNVRKVLGISETQDAILTPHNLEKYRVFAESRTVNRKLVRGTNVLVDKTQKSHKNPTWGDLNKALGN